MMELLLYKDDGSCELISDMDNIEKAVIDKNYLKWLNVENPTNGDMRFLEQQFRFHPLAIEDCMADIQRPKIDKYDGYLFIVLHAASRAEHKDKATSLEVDIFLGANFIITVHMKPIKCITTAQERCTKNSQIMKNGPANIFYNIADALVDNYFPILESIDSEIDAIEKSMFKEPKNSNIHNLLVLKETVMTLRRFIAPQRVIVKFLERGDYQPIISNDLSLYFRDLTDLLARVNDTLYSYSDILSSMLEGYTFVASSRLNEIMKVLTIIATIAMPLTLLSGIYGMNFRFMPELQWKYGYFFALVLMVSIGISMLLYFKHKKWL